MINKSSLDTFGIFNKVPFLFRKNSWEFESSQQQQQQLKFPDEFLREDKSEIALNLAKLEEMMADPDMDLGFDIQEAVKQRLAQKNKKCVQLNDLLKDTNFTKSEIRTMYRGFKQVRNKAKIPLYFV